MNRIRVQSSNIVSVGYDEKSKVLEIEFDNGIYQYFDVPQDVYEDFMNAPSLGKFFHKEIKGKYRFTQVA
jgi:hypothetical protein